ncbi:MAG: alpha-hydroxy-acid oxidizing protein [Acidobacteria bacterium]|nr:alpha-hydroxy-acid oxidizing protein [Acidobacteriota bacterium]
MTSSRREFFQFLAASTVLTPSVRAWAQQLAVSHEPAALMRALDALQVMDFEAAARRALAPAHWGYMASGVDDDLTLKVNVEAFRHIQMKPRRLVDVSKPDLATDVFGVRWETPLFICPVGGQRAFHADGELATARAAKARRHTMILSNVSTYSVEEVAKTLGTPPWQQLYMPLKWDETVKMVKRIEDAGCPVLVWTVDLLAGRNTPTMTRFAREDTRDCVACHVKGAGVPVHRPMYDGLEGRFNPPDATWATFDRLKALTRMKVVLKGIDSAEDAQLAVQHGVDGLVVSNHGGRATETLRGTIDCLPEVVQAVKGRVPVFLDGGVRHGTDIYKALASGARGVGIGRPYIWGLSAFGQEGVERVLEILRAELTMTMKQMGTPTVRDITAARVVRAS